MTELIRQIEEKVNQFRREHPDLANKADELVREYPFSFSQIEPIKVDYIPMSLCPDDEIQHVGYDAAQCGYEK